MIAGSTAAAECACLLPCPETAHQPAADHCVCSSLAENALSTQLAVTLGSSFVRLFIRGVNTKNVSQKPKFDEYLSSRKKI